MAREMSNLVSRRCVIQNNDARVAGGSEELACRRKGDGSHRFYQACSRVSRLPWVSTLNDSPINEKAIRPVSLRNM